MLGEEAADFLWTTIAAAIVIGLIIWWANTSFRGKK